MPIVTFDLPDDLLLAFGGTAESAAKNLRLAAAFHLCGTGRISTVKAARLTGLAYQEFLEAAVRQEVGLYRYSVDEVKEELLRPIQNSVEIAE